MTRRQSSAYRAGMLPRVLLVRSDELAGGDGLRWTQTSFDRELQFLASHTLHHYALVGLMLRTLGGAAPPEFGVAPSTLAIWRAAAPTAA